MKKQTEPEKTEFEINVFGNWGAAKKLEEIKDQMDKKIQTDLGNIRKEITKDYENFINRLQTPGINIVMLDQLKDKDQ